MIKENISVKLNYTSLPIFFVQIGATPGKFLEKILKQAELTNGKKNVYLLTDCNFNLYTDFNCIDISKYFSGTLEFDKLYKHHSVNPLIFEKACFDRWFILNELAKDLNIDCFFHADCDVLISSNISPVYKYISDNKYDGSIMYFEEGENSITSGHSSFWSSKLLDRFCKFICAKYGNDVAFDQLLRLTAEGKFLNNTNVSDMILLDLFRTEEKPNVLNLLSLEHEGITFDFNVNVTYNGYLYNFARNPFFNIKKIYKRAGCLYAKVKQTGSNQKYIEFYTFHFQGYLTKSLIPIYLKTPNFIVHINNYLGGLFTFLGRTMLLQKNKTRDLVKLIYQRIIK